MMFSSLWLQESRSLVVKTPSCSPTACLLSRGRRRVSGEKTLGSEDRAGSFLKPLCSCIGTHFRAALMADYRDLLVHGTCK